MPSTILLMSYKVLLGEVTCSEPDTAKQSLSLPGTIPGFFFQ